MEDPEWVSFETNMGGGEESRQFPPSHYRAEFHHPQNRANVYRISRTSR